MPLKQTLSRHWFRFQRELFPWLEEALGPLGERYQRLVRVLELMRVEESLPYSRGGRGRPLEDRAALARAFLAKAVKAQILISLLVPLRGPSWISFFGLRHSLAGSSTGPSQDPACRLISARQSTSPSM